MNLLKSFKAYYKDMNSEQDGRASIKRNIAWWAFFVACFVIQTYSLYKMGNVDPFPIKQFLWLSFAYVALNYAFILVIIGVTSVKEVKEAAMSWKWGKSSNDQAPKPGDPKNEEA